MRALVQRVSKAEVSVGGKAVGWVEHGLLVLLGIKEGDTKVQVDTLVDKIAKLRVMSDGKDKMNLAVGDTKSGVLVVSQFTLYADTSKGNRPSFIKAAQPQKARQLYDYFVDQLGKKVDHVATGSFGDYMKIQASLDGPVTIILEA